MREGLKSSPHYLAGSLLIAHPVLRDPNFKRTVILMTTDSDEGSVGMVLNRPYGKTLGQLGSDFALTELMSIPVFTGGPVQTEQLILAAWQVRESGFQFHVGLDPEKATALLHEENTHVRAYLGYSGWGKGQLKGELKKNTWIVSQIPSDLFAYDPDQTLWRNVLKGKGEEWRLFAEEPEDPQDN
jgi:putative transcriptional regulator